MFPLLTVLALTPLVGALLLLVVKGPAARWVGLVFSVVTLVLAAVAGISYTPGSGMQMTEQVSWIPQFGAYYSLGLDGIGLTLVLLTAILVPVVLIASWNVEETTDAKFSARGFFGLVLALEAASLYVYQEIHI